MNWAKATANIVEAMCLTAIILAIVWTVRSCILDIPTP